MKEKCKNKQYLASETKEAIEEYSTWTNTLQSQYITCKHTFNKKERQTVHVCF